MKSYNYQNKNNIINLAYDICNASSSHQGLPVFLCIGETSVLTDTIGAMVGELLIKKYYAQSFVYGNLNFNITNQNLESVYKLVQKKHPKSPIFVVDASLGELQDVGLVKFCNIGVIAGGYTNKLATAIGHKSILACVNTTGINSLIFLKSVKLKTALEMANFIAKSISYAMYLRNTLTQTKSY